jgi:hypothetical protein
VTFGIITLQDALWPGPLAHRRRLEEIALFHPASWEMPGRSVEPGLFERMLEEV